MVFQFICFWYTKKWRHPRRKMRLPFSSFVSDTIVQFYKSNYPDLFTFSSFVSDTMLSSTFIFAVFAFSSFVSDTRGVRRGWYYDIILLSVHLFLILIDRIWKYCKGIFWSFSSFVSDTGIYCRNGCGKKLVLSVHLFLIRWTTKTISWQSILNFQFICFWYWLLMLDPIEWIVLSVHLFLILMISIWYI